MLQNEATVMKYMSVCVVYGIIFSSVCRLRVWSKLKEGVDIEMKWKSEIEKVFEEPH